MAIVASAAGTRLTVHVQPRASRSEIVGPHGDTIKLRIAAPPVDGAANAAVVELIARRLDLPRRAVRIVGGLTDRRKTVEVEGLAASVVRQRLGIVFGTETA
ncbi:MAG: DUF167 domain-containing protein [Gemmatimonadetes bacterium]|nr:DUF167 domain-containing protein [Gemmatimonadota bacterium]